MKNTFVAGIHAVGKSFLCKQAAEDGSWLHASASALIREELGTANWTNEKRVGDPDTNQKALVAAVKRINGEGRRLLLDGHFVLRGKDGEFIYLGAEVFADLNLGSVILVEAPAVVVAARLNERDGVIANLRDIEAFLEAERNQAQLICDALGLQLTRMTSATSEAFLAALPPSS